VQLTDDLLKKGVNAELQIVSVLTPGILRYYWSSLSQFNYAVCIFFCSDGNNSGGSGAPSPSSALVTSPPSSHNPFAKGRSSTANSSNRQGTGPPKQSSQYQESTSANTSPVPRAERQPPKHDPPVNRSRRYPPHSARYDGDDADYSDEDRTSSSSRRRPPSSSRAHSREKSSREPRSSGRRGSDSSTGDEPTRVSPRRRLDSDSSSGSIENGLRKTGTEFEGGTSSEVTPRVVQAVGSDGRRGTKDVRQKALQNSNRKNSLGAEGRRNMKTSASTTSVRSGEQHHDSNRPVTSSHRITHNSPRQQHDAPVNRDERKVRQLTSDIYSESQSYFDEHGTGYNELGELDGTWKCLKSSCNNISYDRDLDYCEKCATRRGNTGQRGDNVRLSLQQR
jgi:hypothetical protein